MQDSVAEGGDLGAGQAGVAANADEPAQVTRSAAASTISSQAALAQKRVTRQVAQPGGFEFADAVLDAGVLTVPQFQAGDLAGHDTGRCVGDERGDPHAVGVGEPQLRTGVGAFLAQDQPRVRPATMTG